MFWSKGPVKLIKRVKMGHSFLQSVSNQFHVIILSLPTNGCQRIFLNPFLKFPLSENNNKKPLWLWPIITKHLHSIKNFDSVLNLRHLMSCVNTSIYECSGVIFEQ